jgi:DNA adenine methylase
MPRRMLGAAAPILKWAGGKGQLLGELLKRVREEFGTYHEPFVGGGALFFALFGQGRIQHAVLSDVNRDLIETYETVRDDVESVIGALGKHDNEKEHFYRIRAQDPRRLSRTARAARLIYLNKTCFNGLYRVNSRGQFNVPFGDNPRATICDAEGLRAAAAALRHAELCCESFENVLDRSKPGDFVYFDPPYQPLNKTAYFTAYSREGFGEADQRRLADVFRVLAERGVHVLLSNSDTPLARGLYRDFARDVVQAARAINSKADRRGKIGELLVRSDASGRRAGRARRTAAASSPDPRTPPPSPSTPETPSCLEKTPAPRKRRAPGSARP